MYYTVDHYSEEDNYMYYDTHSTHVYSASNVDVSEDKSNLSSKPISVETKEPDYKK